MNKILQHRNLILFFLHIALFALTLYPILSVTVLPFTDYPNHLARAFIIYNEARMPAIDAMYDIDWELAPYLAMEVLLTFFQSFMSIYAAGKLFITISFLLIVTGVLVINRQLHAQISFLTLLIYPFLYNLTLLWGFINFMFGIGIALLSFALWLHFRKHLTPLRLSLFFIVLTFNYFSHAITYAILGLTLALYESFSLLHKEKTTWKPCLYRLLTLALLALPHFLLWQFVPKTVLTLGTYWGGVTDVIAMIGTPLWFTYSWLEWSLLVLTLILFYLPDIRTDKALGYVILALALISFLIPVKLWGIYLANLRIPLFIMFLLLASAHFVPPASTWKKWGYALLIATICLGFSIRYHTITQNMQHCDTMAGELRSSLREAALDAESPLFTLMNYKQPACPFVSGFQHLPTLAVIESQLFVPEVFTIIPPVKPTAAFKAIDVPLGEPKNIVSFFSHPNTNQLWQETGSAYRYILVLDAAKTRYDVPKSWQVITQGSFFTLYDNHLFTGNRHEIKP